MFHVKAFTGSNELYYDINPPTCQMDSTMLYKLKLVLMSVILLSSGSYLVAAHPKISSNAPSSLLVSTSVSKLYP